MTKAKKVLIVVSSLVFSAFIVLDANFIFAVTPDELKKSIEDKTRELDEINRKILKTQNEIVNLGEKTNTLNREIKKADYQINQLDLGLKASQIKVEKLSLEIETLDQDISDKQKNINLKKKAVVNFLRELQEKDSENILMIFLKNSSLAQSFEESESLTRLNENLALEINSLEISKNELNAKLNQASEKKNQKEIESLSLKNKKLLTENQKKERRELLSVTKNQERLYQEQLKDLEKKQDEIGNAIEAIEIELRQKFDMNLLPAKRPGVLKNPILGNSNMTQEYGATAFAERAYSTKFHNGADFGAPLGTPVAAARDGKVKAVGDNGRYQYGKYVLIEHDNGLTTLYAHLSGQTVANDQTVKTGEIIGYIGSTGYSFGAHLHLGLYWSSSVLLKSFSTCRCGLIPVGITIDPLDYLERI